MQQRAQQKPVSRFRSWRPTELVAALAVASAVLAAVTAVPAPALQPLSTQAADSAATVRTSLRAGGDELTPTTEKLADFVARHYRVAREASRELVSAAFREGRRNGVDPLLILAVIAVESRFNPIAESAQGAVGLMQIVPRMHRDKADETGATSFLPARVNIAIGTRILRESIRRGGGEVAGLQLYNGSSDDETRAYANRVQAERRRLEDALPRPRNRA